MVDSVEQFELTPELDGARLFEWLRQGHASKYLLLRRSGVDVVASAIERMIDALDAPLAATASPIRCGDAPGSHVAVTPLHDCLPPPPSVGAACADACLVSSESLLTVSLESAKDRSDAAAALRLLSERLATRGWRHVAAPGTAIACRCRLGAKRELDDGLVAELEGLANVGLDAHRQWVSTRLRPVRLLIDGACLTGDLHNGSQTLVLHVARALKDCRPDAEVAVAVPHSQSPAVEQLLGRPDISVVDRGARLQPQDVVYRPYQMLDPGELRVVGDLAPRLVVGQLDMIGFANRSYHPSAAMFHEVRNLQRYAMRVADGVTCISEFGLACAVAECPDLDPRRLFVVSCGVDMVAPVVGAPVDISGPFIACLSSTFWHKNREHAIRVFVELCERYRYEGALVITGPEPYYGRSVEAEDDLLASVPSTLRHRVLRLGRVDDATKWSLLRAAELVIYPSVVEGFGLIPFEAATVGTPCVMFAGTGVFETLGSIRGVVGTWHVEAWAEAAARLLSSPAERAMAVDEVTRVGQNHTWSRVAARTWDAIDATIALPRARWVAEEGGPRSRVAHGGPDMARSARAVHFGNRVAGVAARRVRRGFLANRSGGRGES